MTELRTGNLGNDVSFFAAQNTFASRGSRQGEVTGGFMQSLKQTGAAEADMGQTPDKTSPVSKSPSAATGQSTAKTENATDKAASNDTANGASDIRETSSAAGTVKVDEKALKELNDLKGIKETAGAETENAAEAAGGLNGETEGKFLSEEDAKAAVNGEEAVNAEKSLTEQAKEALENAMLKAFKELNDPEKQQEEFEEKLLLFLMKLVDSINGKTEKKSPLTDEEDEEEEKLGGTLMQIIDSMLENAAKNAEMNGDQSASFDTSVIGDYFLNLDETVTAENSENGGFDGVGIDQETAVKAVRTKLYPEYKKAEDGGKAGLQPVIPRVDTRSAGGEAVTDAVGNITVKSAEDTMLQNAGDISVISPVHIEEAVLEAANVGGTPNVINAVDIMQNASVETESAFSIPAAEQVVTIESGLNAYNNTSGENPAPVIPTVPDIVAEKPYEGFEVNDALGALTGVTSEVNVNADAAEENAAETAVRTAADNEAVPSDDTDKDALYEQLAQNVYSDVKRTLKNSFAAKSGETEMNPAGETLSLAQTERDVSETEFDELARLFGLKKEEEPFLYEEENDETESSKPVSGISRSKEPKESDTNSADKESLFGIGDIEIGISSVKAADAPVSRTLPTGGTVSRVVTQIVNQILSNVPEKGQETTLTVTLNPETLGKISLKLVENAGKISVTITAENKETAAILASRAESVQESMRDQGTQLEKYQVVYGAEQDGKAEQQNYEGSSKNPYVRDISEESDDGGEFEEILMQAI